MRLSSWCALLLRRPSFSLARIGHGSITRPYASSSIMPLAAVSVVVYSSTGFPLCRSHERCYFRRVRALRPTLCNDRWQSNLLSPFTESLATPVPSPEHENRNYCDTVIQAPGNLSIDLRLHVLVLCTSHDQPIMIMARGPSILRTGSYTTVTTTPRHCSWPYFISRFLTSPIWSAAITSFST